MAIFIALQLAQLAIVFPETGDARSYTVMSTVPAFIASSISYSTDFWIFVVTVLFVASAVHELLELRSIRSKYFKDGWNFLELFIISTGLTWCGLIVSARIEARSALEDFVTSGASDGNFLDLRHAGDRYLLAEFFASVALSALYLKLIKYVQLLPVSDSLESDQLP
jgi:hypothetical protein